MLAYKQQAFWLLQTFFALNPKWFIVKTTMQQHLQPNTLCPLLLKKKHKLATHSLPN